jgi:hypothetical protein
VQPVCRPFSAHSVAPWRNNQSWRDINLIAAWPAQDGQCWPTSQQPASQLQDQGSQANAHPQTHNAEKGSPEGFVFGIEEVAQEMPGSSVVCFAI